MRIIRVTCRGFKTYRDTMTVGPLGPGLNCVAGLNGSGKSSFFHAIVFVLSPYQGGLCSSGTYLHEGSGGKALSGFVEVELDNRGREFPIDSDKVVLRRTLAGVNKNDDFMINGKHVSRNEYITLLQTSGLIGRKKSSLPFFVVEQGRIAAIATISENERFELVKEAAGIDVFDEKRAESISTLDATHEKRERVVQLLSEIEQKCRELELESAELEEYSKLKREKEWTEYQAASLETDQLIKLKSELSADIQSLGNKIEELRSRQLELETVDAEIEDNEDNSKNLNEFSDLLGKIRLEIASKLAEKSDIDILIEKAQNQLAQSQTLLASMEAKRESLRVELSAQTDRLNEEKLARTKLEQVKRDCERQLESSSTESLADRQQQLELLLGSLDRRKTATEKELDAKTSELETLVTSSIPELEAQVSSIQSELSESECRVKSVEQARLERERNRTEKSAALFTLKQRGFEIDRETERLEKEFRDMSGSVLRSSNWNTRDLISRSDIPGVKGLLGEFLSIPSAYRTAVESVSRAVLFNVIVDSDEVADLISAKLSGGKGRVTLCAINRVGDESQSAESMAKDIQKSGLHAQLLSTVITAREDADWVKKMISKFFSKTAIVDSLDTGVEIAKRFNIDAVTVDGDVVSRDLVVKGGDLVGARKQTELVRNWQQSLELKLKISALKREQASVGQETRNLENEIRELSQHVEGGMEDGRNLNELKNRLETAKRRLHALVSQKSDFEKFQLVNLRDVELKAIAEDIARTRDELSEVRKRRSSGEVKSGDRDSVPISEIQNRLQQVGIEVNHVDERIGLTQKRVASLKSELDHFVENRISHLSEVSGEYLKELSVRKSQAQKLSERMQALESTELLRAEADLKRVEAEQAERRSKKESALQQRSQVETERSSIEQEIQTLTTTMKGKEIKLANIETDLVSLGVSTSSLSATPTIGGTVVDLRQLRARIVDINVELNSNKFVYLNKKSVDQFERVSAERAELVARFQELEETHNNIRELLAEMAEKEKAMIRESFARVQLYFRALFVRLIGEGGSADLRLEIDQDSTSGILGRVAVEQVSIPAGGDAKSKHKHLHELSGGQRTMVALCFLLALQKASSESKNYLLLLDEVDAALDSNYRAAIAEVLVHEATSNGTQVLLTSFRPEFCSVADKHWLVSMVNGTTRIDSVDVATALALVSGEPRYQELTHHEISARE